MRYSTIKMLIWLLVFVVFCYQCLDMWQTHLLLEMGAYEANPIIDYAITKLGFWGGVSVVKGFFMSILVVTIGIFMPKTKEKIK